MDPSQKVCIVTGGAQGLGKEVAKQLLQRGAKVRVDSTYGGGRVISCYQHVASSLEIVQVNEWGITASVVRIYDT